MTKQIIVVGNNKYETVGIVIKEEGGEAHSMLLSMPQKLSFSLFYKILKTLLKCNLVLVEFSSNTLVRTRKFSHHASISSGVHSRSRSYDKSIQKVHLSLILMTPQKHLPHSNRNSQRKLKSHTTYVNVLITFATGSWTQFLSLPSHFSRALNFLMKGTLTFQLALFLKSTC